MNQPVPRHNLGRNLLVAGSVLIAATIAAAIALTPSPQQHRDFQRDQRVISDLGALQLAIAQWQQQHGQLPAGLAELNTQPGVLLALQPADGAPPYRYQPSEDGHYQLCAHFRTDSADPGSGRPGWAMPGAAQAGHEPDLEWAHGLGEHCYQRRVRRPDTPAASLPLD